ncbi:MAG: hypothetical protein II820_04890 [Ruminiclostridium sp.]|nr:hypothetical protein [Ruminiclostridium sp.]
MKKTISFLLAVLSLLSFSGCDSPPIELSPPIDLSPLIDDGDYPDKMYSYAENNAELVIFRAGGVYLTYSRDKDYWIRLVGDVPDRMMLGDGRFELISADIKRYSGGIAGYMGNPEIVRLNAYEPMTTEQAVTLCGLKDYDPELARSGEPFVYGEYLFCANRVYHGGTLVGEYSTQPEAEAAMGLRVIPDSSVEMERLGKYYLYVFRCGDQYLSYCPHIGMNSCWTPYINSRFGNEPEAFTLEDGESAYIHSAEIIKLNGGNAGYVNVPMVMNDEDYEIVGYDIISDRMPPYWGVFRSGKYEDTDGNSKDRAEFSDTCNAMFDRDVSGTWLIFYIDGKYRVYLDDHEDKKQIGIYDTPEEVNALFR